MARPASPPLPAPPLLFLRSTRLSLACPACLRLPPPPCSPSSLPPLAPPPSLPDLVVSASLRPVPPPAPPLLFLRSTHLSPPLAPPPSASLLPVPPPAPPPLFLRSPLLSPRSPRFPPPYVASCFPSSVPPLAPPPSLLRSPLLPPPPSASLLPAPPPLFLRSPLLPLSSARPASLRLPPPCVAPCHRFFFAIIFFHFSFGMHDVDYLDFTATDFSSSQFLMDYLEFIIS